MFTFVKSMAIVYIKNLITYLSLDPLTIKCLEAPPLAGEKRASFGVTPKTFNNKTPKTFNNK
jgi:hypothetical protein